MHIDITKNRKYSRALLRTSYREGGKVKKRTIANLSDCSPADIAAIDFGLKNHKKFLEGNFIDSSLSNIQHGKSIGAAFVLAEIAKRTGITAALGDSFNSKLALWQILSRVLDQGSRLSSVRLHETHLLAEAVELDKGFCEDNLYNNLAWLAENQNEIEDKLFKQRPQTKPLDLALYDVTSSYLEGQNNELAAFGYNRDGKKGKKQIVVGLLCDFEGCPISIQVFSGNTSDTKTFHEQIKKVAERFKCERVTFVGDRGMIKSAQKKDLNEAGFHYITALTKAQIETLEKEKIIEHSLFDDNICHISHEGNRYILRKNPIREEEIALIRASKEKKIINLINSKNKYLKESKRANPEIALKKVNEKIAALKCLWLVAMITPEGTIILQKDNEKLKELAYLDGCYVVTTDLMDQNITPEMIHNTYKNLWAVENDFRNLKTVHLEMRPIHVRKVRSTRGHIFVLMLAHIIKRYLDKYWENFNMKTEEGIDTLKSLSTVIIATTNDISIETTPIPTGRTKELLKAINYTLPESIVRKKICVDTRKKTKKKVK